MLAADVDAPLSLPVFDNSAMDGYAVRAEDVAGADADHPVRLPVAADIPAGRTDPLTLAPGTTHRIMTGAPLPAGADAIVPVEATDAGTETVEIRAASRSGQHVRRAGEDVTVGTTVLRAGQPVTPAALGLAAALGLGELTVIPRQRVLVMSTGSELVSAGTELKAGQIYESNAIMLAAAVREAGGEVVATPTSSDDVTQFSAVLEGYSGQADLIITTGGVSAGAYEVVKDAFGAGAVDFVKVAMQPGMPQGAGRVTGAAGPATSSPGTPDRHAARQPGQRAGLLRGVRPARTARGDGPALAAAPAAHRGAHRGPDLTGRQAAVPPRGLRRRRGHRHHLRPRRRTICAGWHRQTACWRYRGRHRDRRR